MAIRFATKNGDWSDPTVWNGGTLPTVGDDVYPNNFNVNIDQDITVDKLSAQSVVSPSVTAGGRFVIVGNHTINANVEGSGTALTNNNTTLTILTTGLTVTINGNLFHGTVNSSYSLIIGTGNTVIINGNVDSNNLNNIQNIFVIYVSGTSQLTINGNLINRGFNTSNKRVIIGENDTLITINGNIEQFLSASSSFVIQTGGNLTATGTKMRVFSTIPNIVGTRPSGQIQTFTLTYDEYEAHTISASIFSMTSELSEVYITGKFTSPGLTTLNRMYFVGNGKIYYTGDIYAYNNTTFDAPVDLAGVFQLFVYGNVYGANTLGQRAINYVTSTPKLFIYGNVIGGTLSVALAQWQNTTYAIIFDLNAAGVTIDGNIVAISGTNSPAIGNRAISCVIEELVCTSEGVFPVTGRFRVRNGVTLLKLRDENDNEVSYTDQSTNDYPIESDVRNGVEYGFNLEGTCNVPLPSQVSLGVPIDNTLGTGIVTSNDFLEAIKTSSDPLAERLRNVATTQIVGDQFNSFK
jgi:hypothetical protein